jgi:competence ComEA-like helix-hairpin-helix protein
MVGVSALAMLCAITIGLRAQDASSPAPSGEGLPDGPGKDVMVRTCGMCHEPRRAASVRLTRDGWQAVVDDMRHRGAKGTDEEFATIMDYLTANFLGETPRPVNVNTAPAIDLELVIGLLRKESAAVIAYREKHGAFKEIVDLKKVPGLDYKKIDAAKDRIVCF